MSSFINALALETTSVLINAVSAANTAAATSSGFDLTGYEGVVVFRQNIGAVTGSIVGKIQGSVDNSNWYDLTAGGSFATNATNTVVELPIDTTNLITSVGRARYARYVGTVTTGPILLSVTVSGFKKVSA